MTEHQNNAKRLSGILEKYEAKLTIKAVENRNDSYGDKYVANIRTRNDSYEVQLGYDCTYDNLANSFARLPDLPDAPKDSALAQELCAAFEDERWSIEGLMFEGVIVPHKEFTEDAYREGTRDVPIITDRMTEKRAFPDSELREIHDKGGSVDFYIRCSANQFDLVAKVHEDDKKGGMKTITEKTVSLREHEVDYLKGFIDVAREKVHEKAKPETG